MTNAVVYLHQHASTSLASKSTRVTALVDPVPVLNLSGDENKEAPKKCNHFTIRGYVSEVRKRNPTLCYPFTLQASTDLANELPPMEIPKFRWWQCSDCVPEAAEDLQKDSCGTGHDEAQNFKSADDPALLLGHSLKVNNAIVIRNPETNTSTDSNDNRNYLQVPDIYPDRKGKGKAHAKDELPLSSGFGNGFLKDFRAQWILPQTKNKIDVNQSAISEVVYFGNGTPEALNKAYTVDRGEAGSSKGYGNPEKDHTTDNHRGVPQTSLGNQDADPPANGLVAATVGIGGPRNHSQGLNLPDLNECSGEPSFEEIRETIVTGSNINSFCEDDDDYLGAERRKKPKVRLLSDLLGLKGGQGPAKGKKKTPSSASSQDENVKRKRSVVQDEGSQSLDIRDSNEGSKKTAGTSDMSESESESDSDDVSTEKISEALAKRRCKPRDPLPEKRNKKPKVDHGDSSSLPQEMIKPKSLHGQGKSTEEPAPKRDIFAQLRLRNSVLTKKRGKSSQARREPTLIMPCKNQMRKEVRVIQDNGEPEQSAAGNVQKATEDVHLFASSLLTKDKEKLYSPLGKDSSYLPASQAESMLADGNRIQNDKENGSILESLALRTPAVGPSFTGNQSDGGRRIGPVSDSNEKRAEVPAAEERRHVAQIMPMQVSHVVTQREHANEVRGRVHDIDINSIPVDDKVCEQGMGDDIPMDIVELMAKNQYERHLDDPKDDNASHPSCGTYGRQNGASSSYGQPVPPFMQSQFFSMRNPPSTDPRSSLFEGNMAHFPDHHNPLGVHGLPRGRLLTAGLLSPSQVQDLGHPYSIHAFAAGSWNGNNQFPSSIFQTVDKYQKDRATAPRHSIAEAPRFWAPRITSRMPIGITNPQMISHSSNARTIHQQSSGSILNFSAAPATSLEKLQNLSFSGAYNSGKPESSSRSVNTNVAIPAMNLMSLMENPGKVQNTELSLGPQKVVGPSSSKHSVVRNGRTSLMQGNSAHPCYPTVVPSARSFAAQFQNDAGNLGKSITGPTIPLTLGGQRNMESSHFVPRNGEHQSLRRPVVPRDKGKAVASMPKPLYINKSQHVSKGSSKMQYPAGVRRDENSASPSPDKMICQLNQNPSEFNDLKLMSQYMIGPEDLKPSKKTRDKASRSRGDARSPVSRVSKSTPSGTGREKQRS